MLLKKINKNKISRIQTLLIPSFVTAVQGATIISHPDVCSGFPVFTVSPGISTADFVTSFKYNSDRVTPLLKTLLWILFSLKEKPDLHNGQQGST